MSKIKVSFRPEYENDFEEIDKLLKVAFGGNQEVVLVNQIRKSNEYIPSLSFVAVHNDAIIGHLMFSRINLLSESGENHPVLSLAPVCVLPQHQKQGVGSALIRHGLSVAKESSYPLIVVIGHPNYYLKFGFDVAKPYGLWLKYKVPDDAFFLMELQNGFLQKQHGQVEFPLYFDDAM